MLKRLTIRDFVIVDKLELEFAAGFGTLTGETGAGKSILLDALGLALGDRADATTVRSGRDKADVVAEFELQPTSPLQSWLEEQDIPSDDGLALLRRVVDAGGRSRGWINGIPVTLAQLREAGEWLADIHGQHAHHALLRADAQRSLLDAHAGAGEVATKVAGCYREWQRVVRLREEADRDSAASARQRELLEWQLTEIERVGFDPAEWNELNSEQNRLAHAAGLIGGTEEVLATLGDGEVSARSLLGHANSRIGALADLDSGLGEVSELLDGALIQADEALHALRRYRDRLDLDPGRLEEIDRRIAAISDIARKHHVTPDDLPGLRDTWARELGELAERADPARLAILEGNAREAFEAAAKELSLLRAPAAAALSREITAAMQTLAMAGGRFEVALEPLPEGASHGLENIEFRVSANPDQPLRSLAKVASGGELSRIGLAIQVMTSRDSAIPTLIFDEVDVGIGGGVAERVGKLLHQIGRERQVLCVTHLPQVAACADWQWSIARAQRGRETVSEVTMLDETGRIDEVARMLGGMTITETTRRHAAELLGLGPSPAN